MRIRFSVHFWIVTQLMVVRRTFGRVLTHGPVVGGVTETDAKVFVRTDQTVSVQVRYSTDPTFTVFSTSDPFATNAANDFTEIIPLNATSDPAKLTVKPAN